MEQHDRAKIAKGTRKFLIEMEGNCYNMKSVFPSCKLI